MENLDALVDLLALKQCPQRDIDDCLGQLESALEQIAQQFGYRFLRFGCRRKDVPIGSMDVPGVYISNFPAEWDTTYVEQAHYLYDPVVRFGAQPESADFIPYAHWSAVKTLAQQQPCGADPKAVAEYISKLDAVFALAASHQVRDGLYMTELIGHEFVQLSLATPNANAQPLNEGKWKSLKAAMLIAHTIAKRILTCQSCYRGALLSDVGKRTLSVSQIEILNLFFTHRGATIKEIAAIRNSSLDTINYHLRHIREIFDMKGASGLTLALHAKENYYI